MIVPHYARRSIRTGGSALRSSGWNSAVPAVRQTALATRTPLTILASVGARPILRNDERAALLIHSQAGDTDDRFTVVEVLSPTGDLRESARCLFAALRKLDSVGLDRIYVEPCKEEGLGVAIMDRLRRCAAP